MDGAAEIAFACRDGRTHLAHLYHRAPLRVLFPTAAPGDIPLAALATTSGGLVGGDRLRVSVSVGAEARGITCPQAAEKVYRSTGDEVSIHVGLAASENGWLEWLPQETILFDASRLRRTTLVAASPSARVLAGEMLVFGRTARGERLTNGVVYDAWRVRRDGCYIWSDAFRLDGEGLPALAHHAGLADATAYATAIYVADDAADRLADARDILDTKACRAAATHVAGVLIIRWLGADTAAVRRSFGLFWAEFRCRVAALPAELPRLWHV